MPGHVTNDGSVVELLLRNIVVKPGPSPDGDGVNVAAEISWSLVDVGEEKYC